MFSDPFAFLLSIVFLLPAIVIAVPAHELGHVIAATAQGDQTARNRGYLRPEPRQFFTPYGLLMIIFWKVGWGAQAPINEYRLKGTWGRIAYALGGPVANLVLAIVFGLITRSLLLQGAFPSPTSLHNTPRGYVCTVTEAIFFLNLSLFAFNLLPVPGFDGWRIVETLFRRRFPRFFFDAAPRQLQIQQVLLLALFIAQFFAGNLLNVVLIPFYQPAAMVILGVCGGYLGLAPCLPSAGS